MVTVGDEGRSMNDGSLIGTCASLTVINSDECDKKKMCPEPRLSDM
jgi:hypothetical protein